MRLVGIDYSLSCPAIAINSNGFFAFHYLTSVKKFVGNIPTNNPKYSITGHAHIKEYSCNEERFNNIAEWVLSLLEPTDLVCIEGYAFASAGLVFNIAENCGIMKHKLWKAGIKYRIIPPSVAKKVATCKGNANKELMCEAFISATGLNIYEMFNSKKAISPLNDMADAYWLSECLESI